MHDLTTIVIFGLLPFWAPSCMESRDLGWVCSQGSVAKFDFWAKSKNFVSGIQWLTDSKTLEKATLRQNRAEHGFPHLQPPLQHQRPPPAS